MKEGNEIILKGLPASSGIVKGKVIKIENPGVATYVPEGYIIVTKFTTPLLTLAMLKCIGIITEKGGITSHAATVARELGIPCVVSCDDALKKLKNEMEVTLDGTQGYVYK